MKCSDQQRGVLALFEHVDKPATLDAFVGMSEVPTRVPTEEEYAKTCERLNLKSLGIGIAPRGRSSSLFDRDIMKEASNLATLLVGQKNYDETIKACAAVRSEVNEEIYVYAMMYAFLNRKDTQSIELPPVEEVVPYWYFPSSVITAADRQLKATEGDQTRVVVDYTFSHNELDSEYRMAYFREDIAVNSHHWHWHVAYPTYWVPSPDVSTKDRKGELFYFMHQQIMARYDTDRMANNLQRVQPLNDFRQGLDLGYFPNLMSTISGGQYASRPANMPVVDTDGVSLDRMALWKSRILNAIHSKTVMDEDEKPVPLEDPEGIDKLGDLLEASSISINQGYYGDYHNSGHIIISRAHDPEGKFTPESGVMGFSSTAMRDPIFYRWHKGIDNIFDEYKLTQPAYTKAELEWTDIVFTGISVRGDITKKQNFLQTFWKEREVLLSRGVDFDRENSVSVKVSHLDHEEFAYDIAVENKSGKDLQAMVRIFLAPVSNEQNAPLRLREQRRLFIELDKYTVTVKPGMQNLIRRSEDSNVTLPSVRSFEQIEETPNDLSPTATQGYCSCGWPHHLLIPKGRAQGMKFLLFAMLTNWENDKIPEVTEETCLDSFSYCGIRNQKYPDKRNMGFPFDRPLPSLNTTIQSFRTENMSSTEIVIRYANEIRNTKNVLRQAPIF